MEIHKSFADWYRAAGLLPTEDLMQKRWAGVEKIAKKPTLVQILDHLLLFVLPDRREESVLDDLRNVFREFDSTFPAKNNNFEMAVLAGAILRKVMEDGGKFSGVTALAIVCGAFGSREQSLPEPDHLSFANKLLVQSASELRKRSEAGAPRVPPFEADEYSETFAAALFAPGQTPNLQPVLAAALTKIGKALADLTTHAKASASSMELNLQLLKEESNFGLWLETKYSKDLVIPFEELGIERGVITLPKELADITAYPPGPEHVFAVLARALNVVRKNANTEKVSISKAVNALARNWRKDLSAAQDWDRVGPICPILLAVSKSLETDGESDWIPVYRKVCDQPVDVDQPVLALSLQVYRELMLQRTIRGLRS